MITKELTVHVDVKNVLEFMEGNVLPERLLAVSEALPGMARLLWGSYPQEPVAAIRLCLVKTAGENPTQLASIESSPNRACERDGSVAATTCQ